MELAKVVKISTDAIDDAQIKLQVAELISALADAKIQATESSELIASLQQQLKSKAQFKFDGSVYYKILESGEQDGPWCPVCKDVQGLEVRLQKRIDSQPSSNWRRRNGHGYFR
jgi:hypothetical protein